MSSKWGGGGRCWPEEMSGGGRARMRSEQEGREDLVRNCEQNAARKVEH